MGERERERDIHDTNRQIASGVLDLAGEGRDAVEANVREEHGAGAAHDALEAEREEVREEIVALPVHAAADDDEDDDAEVEQRDDVVEDGARLDAEQQHQRAEHDDHERQRRQHDQRRDLDVVDPVRHRDAERREDLDHIRRPAACHGRRADGVLEREIPSDAVCVTISRGENMS